MSGEEKDSVDDDYDDEEFDKLIESSGVDIDSLLETFAFFKFCNDNHISNSDKMNDFANYIKRKVERTDAEFDRLIESTGVDIDSLFDFDMFAFFKFCDDNHISDKMNDFKNYIKRKVERTPKRRKNGPDLIKFDPTIEKRPIVIGQVSSDLGGLLDREYSIECLFRNLRYVATLLGDKYLDKKDVPVLGLAAPSESGKTEFLKWVNNQCCTDLNPDTDGMAAKLLREINAASPEGQGNFDNVLVLFASFSQTSTYNQNEEKGMIVQTTIERLLRSYHGNLDMVGTYSTGPRYNIQHFSDFKYFHDILTTFENDRGKGKTAFIFCIDELSKLHDTAYDEYKILMDSLLAFSHISLRDGSYCAIVASSLEIAELGEYVVQKSRRALAPIYFRDNKPEIRKKAMEVFLEKSSVLECPEEDKEKELFICAVKTAILESYTSILKWKSILDVDKSTRRMTISYENFGLPEGIDLEDVFELCSRTLFKAQKNETMDEKRLKGIVDKLHGRVRLSGTEQVYITKWETLSVRFSLPVHRLLQITTRSDLRYRRVEKWVVNAVYKLYYVNETADDIVKTWELATIAMLDLRRAMQYVAKGNNSPSLNQMFVELDGPNANQMFVHHTLDDRILNSVASDTPARQQQSELPRGDNIFDSPIVITSKIQNKKGIEGVFQNAFRRENGDPIHVLFQMKLYTSASPKQISDWLSSVNKRAADLGYSPGTYIVQLFVTGAVEGNITDRKGEWPTNSMVFGTVALKHLFAPFGDGFIVEIVNARTRKSDQKK